MRVIVAFLLSAFLFFSCDSAQKKCERVVLSEFSAEDDHVFLSFSNFSRCNICMDSLRNTGALCLQYDLAEMYAKLVEEHLAVVESGEDCPDWDCKGELAAQREMLMEAEEMIGSMEGMFTAKNYVIDYRLENSMGRHVIRYYLNDRYEIMSFTVMDDEQEGELSAM